MIRCTVRGVGSFHALPRAELDKLKMFLYKLALPRFIDRRIDFEEVWKLCLISDRLVRITVLQLRGRVKFINKHLKYVCITSKHGMFSFLLTCVGLTFLYKLFHLVIVLLLCTGSKYNITEM